MAGAHPEQPIFYYDLASPEAYLVAERSAAVLGEVPEWQAVRLGGLRAGAGGPLPRAGGGAASPAGALRRGGGRRLPRGRPAARGALRAPAPALARPVPGRHGVGHARRDVREADR